MSSFQNDIRGSFLPRYGAVAQIILLNVGVYVAFGLFGVLLLLFGMGSYFTAIFNFLSLPADFSTFITQPWSFMTYSVMHLYPGMGGGFLGPLFHIVFNMLWVYWLGRLLREYLGDRHVWGVYALGIAVGAFLYLLLFNLSPAFDQSRQLINLAGASAGVTAIVVATATLLPNFRVMLFIFGAVQLKWLALIFVVIDIISIMGSNPGGMIAHLGGAALGLTYIMYRKRGVDFSAPFVNFWYWLSDMFKPKKKSHLTVHRSHSSGSVRVTSGGVRPSRKAGAKADEAAAAANQPTQEEVDRILDKIAEVGYEKLSKAEKQVLFKASEDQLES